MLKSRLLKVCEKTSFQKFKAIALRKYFKFFSVFLILILIIFGLALPRGFVNAGLIDIIGNIPYAVIYAVFWVLFIIAHLIAYFGALILDMVLNPAIINNVFASPAIYNGWKIIRDICNLLFLLLMLLVAFGTIIQHSKYNIKNSLLKLILAIFLINFSYVIAGAIIDFGNILMYGILKWMCVSETACFSGFTNGLLKIVNQFSVDYGLAKSLSWNLVDSKQAIGLAVATIYTFMLGFIFLALAAFLLVRIAGLALLLILAPFAYFGEVMPGMEKIGQKWWNNIWSYTLFGPIFALILYISGEMASITIAVPPFDSPAFADSGLGWYSGLLTTVISNTLPLLFLLAIIPVTKELGLAGTDTIMKNTTGWGEKIGKGAVSFAGGAVDRFAARGANMTGQGKWATFRRGLSYASPGAWKRAIKMHTADKEHDYDVATGKTRNVVARTDDWLRKSPIDYGEDAEQREVARQRADIKGKNKDELVHLMGQALDKGMMARAEAISLELASTSDMNDVYTKMKGRDGKNYQNTPEGFIKFMDEKFKPGYGEDKTGRLMAEIANLEKRDGHHALKGSSKYNVATGKFEIVRDPNIREKDAAKEFSSVESQGKWRGMDSRTLLDQQYDANGNEIRDAAGNEMWQWGDRGRQILTDMTEEDIKSAWKGKAKHQKRLLSVLENQEEMDSLNDLQRAKAERLRDSLRKAVYGTRGNGRNQQGGGMGVGQAENQESQEARETREAHAREEEEEEEVGISGGSPLTNKQFIDKKFAEIRTKAGRIKSGNIPSSEKRIALDNLMSEFTKNINLEPEFYKEEIKYIKENEEKRTLEAIREASRALKEEIGQVSDKSGDINLDSESASRETLKKSEEYFEEAFEEVKPYNPTLPNYFKNQSGSLGNFAVKLKEENVDSGITKFVNEAVAKNRMAMANNLRQNDMAQLYYSTPKSYGDKDMGGHKKIDLNKYVEKIKQGNFKLGVIEKRFSEVDKMIGKIGGSAGTMLGAEYEKARALYNFAKESKNSKEQQAYLAVAEHTLDSIENGAGDKGIKEILEKNVI